MLRKKLSKNNKPTDLILQALAVFSGVVLALVLTYVMRDGGFHMEYSISRYVGREWWSAVIFALGNFVKRIWKSVAGADGSDVGVLCGAVALPARAV